MTDLYFVYILICKDGSLYTGYTVNLEERLAKHNAGKGAKYTRSRRPVSLLASWQFPSLSQALRVEAAIKKRARSDKLGLIDRPLSGADLYAYLFPEVQGQGEN